MFKYIVVHTHIYIFYSLGQTHKRFRLWRASAIYISRKRPCARLKAFPPKICLITVDIDLGHGNLLDTIACYKYNELTVYLCQVGICFLDNNRTLSLVSRQIDINITCPLNFTVNNVGMMYEHPDSLDLVPEKLLWDLLTVNMGSVTMLTRKILPQMIGRRKEPLSTWDPPRSCSPCPTWPSTRPARSLWPTSPRLWSWSSRSTTFMCSWWCQTLWLPRWTPTPIGWCRAVFYSPMPIPLRVPPFLHWEKRARRTASGPTGYRCAYTIFILNINIINILPCPFSTSSWRWLPCVSAPTWATSSSSAWGLRPYSRSSRNWGFCSSLAYQGHESCKYLVLSLKVLTIK